MPQGWEWLILVAVLLLLFGASRLPQMARSIGQSARVFRGEMRGMKTDEEAKKAAAGQQAGQQPADQQAPPAAPAAALPPVQAPTPAPQVKQDTPAESGTAGQPGSATGSTGQ